MADSTLDILDAVVAKLSELAAEGTLKTVVDYLPSYIDPEELPLAAVLVSGERESLRGYSSTREATIGTKLVDYTFQIELRDLGFADSLRDDTRAFYALGDLVRKKLAEDPTVGGTLRAFGLNISVTFREPVATEETVHFSASLSTDGREAVNR